MKNNKNGKRCTCIPGLKMNLCLSMNVPLIGFVCECPVYFLPQPALQPPFFIHRMLFLVSVFKGGRSCRHLVVFRHALFLAWLERLFFFYSRVGKIIRLCIIAWLTLSLICSLPHFYYFLFTFLFLSSLSHSHIPLSILPLLNYPFSHFHLDSYTHTPSSSSSLSSLSSLPTNYRIAQKTIYHYVRYRNNQGRPLPFATHGLSSQSGPLY